MREEQGEGNGRIYLKSAVSPLFLLGCNPHSSRTASNKAVSLRQGRLHYSSASHKLISLTERSPAPSYMPDDSPLCAHSFSKPAFEHLHLPTKGWRLDKINEYRHYIIWHPSVLAHTTQQCNRNEPENFARLNLTIIMVINLLSGQSRIIWLSWLITS